LNDLFHVLFEDDDVLVINKAAGLVCHPSKDGERSSLVGRVRLYLGHAEGRLVNRLDRETSGIVLVAKNASVAGDLGTLFARGLVAKTYCAIVHGHMLQEQLTIEAPLGKDEKSEIAIKDCIRPDGARARTGVRRIRTFARPEGEFSLVDVTPHSGRKHQIRIHLAHAGHPIVGDKLYGADERLYLKLVTGTLTDQDRRTLILSNQALHAGELAFSWRGCAWRFEAPAGDEFHAFADPRPTPCD
jgi:23S rRNA pseudouridine1911/1915/1917 synthase